MLKGEIGNLRLPFSMGKAYRQLPIPLARNNGELILEAQELIEAFRKELKQVEEKGGNQVSVSALNEYLSALERGASLTQEHRNREHQGMLAHYAAKREISIEMLKAVIDAGKSALHYLLLINGGAVIALFGVLSNLSGKKESVLFAKYLALPTFQFGIGVLLAAVGCTTLLESRLLCSI